MDLSIKNIILDFGGVIFNIDHKKVEDAYRKLGMDNFEVLFSQASQSELFQNFEKGQISPDQFRSELRRISGLNVSDNILDNTWNKILCDYPPHRIKLLNKMKNNYRLFILSNTNIIHYQHYIAMFKQNFGYDFDELFENTFWAFKIGKRKPDPDPYLHILDKHKLKAEETLFIDDSLQNIISAEKLNILAFHLNGEMDISELFKNGFLKPRIQYKLFDKN